MTHRLWKNTRPAFASTREPERQGLKGKNGKTAPSGINAYFLPEYYSNYFMECYHDTGKLAIPNQ